MKVKKVKHALHVVRYDDETFRVEFVGTDHLHDFHILLKVAEKEMRKKHARAVPLTAQETSAI